MMQPPQQSSQPIDQAQYINNMVMKWSQDSKENTTDRKINRMKKFFCPTSSGKKKPEDFFNVQAGGLISATKAQHQKEADKNERKSISKRRLLDDVTNVRLGNEQPVLQPIKSIESASISSPQRLPLAQLNTIPSVVDDNQRDIALVEVIEEHQDGDFVPDTQPQQAPVDNRTNLSIRESQSQPQIQPASSLLHMTRIEDQPMPIMQSSPIVTGRSMGQDVKLKRKSRVEQIRGEHRPLARNNEPKMVAPPSPMQNEFNQSLRRRSASSKRTEETSDNYEQFADIDDIVLGSNEIFAQPNSTPNEIQKVVVNNNRPKSPEVKSSTKNLQIQVIPIDLERNDETTKSSKNKTPDLPVSQPPQSTISITKGKKGAAAQLASKTPSLPPASQRYPSPQIMPPPPLPQSAIQKSATTSVNTTTRSARSKLADVTNTIEAEDNQDDNSMIQSQKDIFLRAKRSSNNSTVNKTAANQTGNKASALFTPALPRIQQQVAATSTSIVAKGTKRGLIRTNLNIPAQPEPQEDVPVTSAASVPDNEEIITLDDEPPVNIQKKRGRKPKEATEPKVAPKAKQQPAAKKDNATVPKKATTRVREEVEVEQENHHEEVTGGRSLRQRHNDPGKRLVYGWDWETTADGQRIYVKKVIGSERRHDYVDELALIRASKVPAKKRQRTKSPKKKTTTATVPNVAKKTKKKVIDDDDEIQQVEEVHDPPQKKKARTTKAARSDQKTPQINDDHEVEDQVVEVAVVDEPPVDMPEVESEDESIGVNIINKPTDVPVIRLSARLADKASRVKLNLDAFNEDNANKQNPALRQIEEVLLENENGEKAPTRVFHFAEHNGTRTYKKIHDNVYIWNPSTRCKEGCLRIDAHSQTRSLSHKFHATYMVQSAHPVVVSVEGVNGVLKAGDVFQVPQGADYMIKNPSKTDSAYFYFQFK